jgi:peroxiredoxin
MDIKLTTQERLELLQLLYQFSGKEKVIDIVESLYNKVCFSDVEKTKLKIIEQPGQYQYGASQEGNFSFDQAEENAFLKGLYDLAEKNEMFNLRNISLFRKLKQF